MTVSFFLRILHRHGNVNFLIRPSPLQFPQLAFQLSLPLSELGDACVFFVVACRRICGAGLCLIRCLGVGDVDGAVGPQKLHRVYDDHRFGPRRLNGDAHFRVRLEAVGPHRHKGAPYGRLLRLIDPHLVTAILMVNDNRHGCGAICARGIGNPDLIETAALDEGCKNRSLLSFVLPFVVNVSVTQKTALEGGTFPPANQLGIVVVKDDAREAARIQALCLQGAGLFQLRLDLGQACREFGFLGVGRLHGQHLLFAATGQPQGLGDKAGDITRDQRLGAPENARQGIVVACRYGIELMIVTAGTAQGHAQEGAAHGVNLFIDHLHAQQFLVLQFIVGGTEHEEAGGGEMFIVLLGAGRREQVTRELFDDEFVEGLVPIERVNHVVTEAPGMLVHEAAPTAAGFGKAGHIQPVPSPAFAIGL